MRDGKEALAGRRARLQWGVGHTVLAFSVLILTVVLYSRLYCIHNRQRYNGPLRYFS